MLNGASVRKSSVTPTIPRSLDHSRCPVPHNALRSFCIVTSELPDLRYNDQGIGTCNWRLAGLLGQEGWRVHILYCGPAVSPEELNAKLRQLNQPSCSLSQLGAYELPRELLVNARSPGCVLEMSDRVRYALEYLHRAQHFSLVEFADYQGLGFRPLQAKRAGLAFCDLTMIVKLHGSSQWQRETNLCPMGQVEELILDYCERYSFENADVQLAPCRDMLDYARSIGWKLQEGARVVPNAMHAEETRVCPVLTAPLEIAFVGPLATRGGLEFFVEAVGKLPNALQISFVGQETVLANGALAGDYIKEMLPGRAVALHCALDRRRTLDYLQERNCLAVIPALDDACPNALFECAAQGIPFLASQAGGIPDLLDNAELQAALLFEPCAGDLLLRIEHYLKLAHDQRQALTARAKEVLNFNTHNAGVIGNYHTLIFDQVVPALTVPQQAATVRLAVEEPLVTVAVTYYNLAEFLPETLASLAAQTYVNFEVLVIDDGSSDSAAIRVFEEQRSMYPQFRFISQANAGLSAARNLALAEADGEYFLPVDADNVARPDMVATFVRALHRNPEVSAVSCYFLAFQHSADLAAENFDYAFRPTAGPHVMGSLQNIYGDANSIFRTADLQAIAGYETDRDCGFEDWEAFVKLINAGFRIDVVPEHLFFYRLRADSMSRTTNSYRNQRRVLRQYYEIDDLPKSERMGLWSSLQCMQTELSHLRARTPTESIANQPADSGFETPQLGLGVSAFQYCPQGSPWSFDGAAGVAANKSQFTAANPDAPQGRQVAFIQERGSLSQAVKLDAGKYALSMDAAQRAGSQQQIQVLVDGNPVGIITPANTSYALCSTALFTIAAGTHTLKLQGLNPGGGDNTAFIDQVFVLPNSLWSALQ